MRPVFRDMFVIAVMTFALSRFIVTSPTLAASITCDGYVIVSVNLAHVDVNEYRLEGSGPTFTRC